MYTCICCTSRKGSPAGPGSENWFHQTIETNAEFYAGPFCSSSCATWFARQAIFNQLSIMQSSREVAMSLIELDQRIRQNTQRNEGLHMRRWQHMIVRPNLDCDTVASDPDAAWRLILEETP